MFFFSCNFVLWFLYKSVYQRDDTFLSRRGFSFVHCLRTVEETRPCVIIARVQRDLYERSSGCKLWYSWIYSSVLLPPSSLAGRIDGSVLRRLILLFFNMVA